MSVERDRETLARVTAALEARVRTREELAADLGVSRAEVLRALGGLPDHLRGRVSERSKRGAATYTREAFESLLRSLAVDPDTGESRYVSGPSYAARRPPASPSLSWVERVYGSWSAAVSAADVPPRPPTRRSYASRFRDRDVVLSYVDLATREGAGTIAAYERWSIETPGAPSASTVRNTLRGVGWPEVKRLASEAADPHRGGAPLTR